MKILQDVVPGCNKVIGKALVLDVIINYIQSLQRQVEFLPMKLEAVNLRLTMNPTIECFPSKDADLLEEGSFDSAVEGSDAVFHTASPAQFIVKDPRLN
ncbi:Myc-type, basic helix-loop-helix [Sesbania bispinosa]|nr:Myc-type, basic helix-loop-helix [Sesbania bispinosa]